MKFCTVLSMLFMATILSATTFPTPSTANETLPAVQPICNLPAPTNLTLTRPSRNRLRTAWTTVANARGYTVVVSNNLRSTSYTSETNVLDLDVATGYQYTVTVAANCSAANPSANKAKAIIIIEDYSTMVQSNCSPILICSPEAALPVTNIQGYNALPSSAVTSAFTSLAADECLMIVVQFKGKSVGSIRFTRLPASNTFGYIDVGVTPIGNPTMYDILFGSPAGYSLLYKIIRNCCYSKVLDCSSPVGLVANNQGNSSTANEVFKDVEPVATEQPIFSKPLRTSHNLIIAPNPFNANITLDYELTENTALSIRILDVTGRVVQRNDVQETAGSHNKVIDASALPKGIYFLQFDDGQKKSVQKIVKVE
jgi:hypothetical protein